MFDKILNKLKLVSSSVNTKDKNKLYSEALLASYKASLHTYEAFLVTMVNLVDSLLVEKGHKYQLQSRVKNIIRLEEKIKRKHALGKDYNNLNEIEDLAGLRIIFYSEADKKEFVEHIKREISGLMRIEEREKRSGYSAIHLVVSFGKKRLKLAEYKKFAGLKCEIQITSAIHHAWAEVEHDIVYKDINGWESIDPKKYTVAKKRLTEVLEKHILKASDEFEKVVEEIRSLK